MPSSFEVTSLFQPQPRQRGGVSAYALSMVLHGAGIALGSWALLHMPVIRPAPLGSRYAVRELKLNMPDRPETERLYPKAPQTPKPDPGKKPPTDQPTPAPAEAEQKTAIEDAPPAPALPRGGGAGKQVLLQPKLHVHDQLADKVPVPLAIIWMPELTPTKLIVPAKPSPPTISMVQPSPAEPNEELEMSDLSVTAADLQPKIPTPPAGTTTPIAQNGPDALKMAPTTESNSTDAPTPTAVLSASDIRMPNGIAVLPPSNETPSAAGNDPGGAPGSGGGGKAASPGGGASQSGTGAGSGPSASSSTAAEASASETVEHIELPPTGKFGVVVVGNGLTAQYPEAANIWSDRVAYTVYLHVGLPKTWILQYGLQRATQANGTGSVGHLEAPWPYDIFRPNLLAVDVNADAVMVHGILNASGKLEQLKVAFPEDYPHASFVVNALSRWQFRPASQDGKPTPVEILLIIPEEDD